MIRSRRGLFLVVLLSSLALQACGTKDEGTPSPAVSPSASSSAPAPAPAAQPSAAQAAYDTETLKNDTGKTMIRSVSREAGNHMSFAIVSKQGTVIVADPNAIPKKDGLPLKADVITSSFNNHSHVDALYEQDNPDAKISKQKAERFTVADVTVTGIAASQSSDPVIPDSPTNVVYLYDVDGLRIAYFGGFGQDALTDEQLKEMGTVDIVLTYFNDAPTWNIKKGTSIKVIEQLKPKIVIPTENRQPFMDEMLGELNAGGPEHMEVLAVEKADLAAITDTKYVFLDALK